MSLQSQTPVSWYVTPCRLVSAKYDVLKDSSAFAFMAKQSEESDPEEASRKGPQNDGNCLHKDQASHPMMLLESSSAQL